MPAGVGLGNPDRWGAANRMGDPGARGVPPDAISKSSETGGLGGVGAAAGCAGPDPGALHFAQPQPVHPSGSASSRGR